MRTQLKLQSLNVASLSALSEVDLYLSILWKSSVLRLLQPHRLHDQNNLWPWKWPCQKYCTWKKSRIIGLSRRPPKLSRTDCEPVWQWPKFFMSQVVLCALSIGYVADHSVARQCLHCCKIGDSKISVGQNSQTHKPIDKKIWRGWLRRLWHRTCQNLKRSAHCGRGGVCVKYHPQ